MRCRRTFSRRRWRRAFLGRCSRGQKNKQENECQQLKKPNHRFRAELHAVLPKHDFKPAGLSCEYGDGQALYHLFSIIYQVRDGKRQGESPWRICK